jgi:organic radical activating enzyme
MTRLSPASATGRYPVNDCYTCIQGEGVQTGVTMVLLRRHGCPWCDTKETWHFDPQQQVGTLAEALGANSRYVYLSAGDIARHLVAHHPGPK